jgi:hypothetical protein
VYVTTLAEVPVVVVDTCRPVSSYTNVSFPSVVISP